MPRISFVLPTHNRVAWVGEAIQSLIDQTEKDIEIVVVDDASDDGTREFLDDWATLDHRVIVLHNVENQGAGRSRNIGMEQASAPIIAVCDDDDVCPDDRATATLRWFEEHPASELVNFPYVRVDYFGNVMEPFYGAEFDHEAFKEKGTISYFSNPTCAFKKASALEMGGYPPETKDMTDDYQFVHKWIEAGKKIDFDNRIFAAKHRVMPVSEMARLRGWRPEWAVAR